MSNTVIIILVIWNICVFLLYGLDKLKAKSGAWRIPEKTLILCAFLMGGIGAFLGMKVFHHKTKHNKFRILVPLFAVLNIIIIVLISTGKIESIGDIVDTVKKL